MPVRIPAAQRAPRRGRLRYKPFTFQPSRYLVRTWWLASGELLNFSLAEVRSSSVFGSRVASWRRSLAIPVVPAESKLLVFLPFPITGFDYAGPLTEAVL